MNINMDGMLITSKNNIDKTNKTQICSLATLSNMSSSNLASNYKNSEFIAVFMW